MRGAYASVGTVVQKSIEDILPSSMEQIFSPSHLLITMSSTLHTVDIDCVVTQRAYLNK